VKQNVCRFVVVIASPFIQSFVNFMCKIVFYPENVRAKIHATSFVYYLIDDVVQTQNWHKNSM